MEALILVFFLFIAIFLLVVAVKTIKIVPQATVMIIERLGRFSRVADSGLNIIVPFLDKPRGVYWTNVRPGLASIDLREQYIDLPPQPVITRNGYFVHQLAGDASATLNERAVGGDPLPLSSGDVLQIGGTQMVFQLGE